MTALLLALFAQNQPYGDARRIPGDIALEIVEAKLDEGLSYLEGDKSRLARKEVAIRKEHGTVREFVRKALSEVPKGAGDILEEHSLSRCPRPVSKSTPT